jgi:predicted transcriptional regulator
MIRTQIYLTDGEKAALNDLSHATGKAQSQLIREAIDQLVERSSKARREEVLADSAGLWKDQQDVPDLGVLREAWDRGSRP